MKKIDFKYSDQNIIRLLGEQNFSTKFSALLELVKNSYDAGAKNVSLSFQEDEVIISDDGLGMDEKDIIDKWMFIGNSEKDYISGERILSGNMGIGRLALANIGKKITLYSKKISSPAIMWSTDGWQEYNIEKSKKEEKGTKIIINKINSIWDEEDIITLRIYMSKIIKNFDDFIIKIKWDSKEYVINNCFDGILIDNFMAKINIEFNGEDILKLKFEENIFEEDKILDIIPDYNKEYSKEINLIEDKFILSEKEKKNILNIGKFNAIFYWGTSKGKSSIERFRYKENPVNRITILKDKDTLKKIRGEYKYIKNNLEGIILYRNNFSVSGYDGETDWLELAKRVQKSPATQTHPTGKYRLRPNNIFGTVNIDKKTNNKLRDLSNRQGLEDNIEFRIFKKLLIAGINEFESKYQKNILKIEKVNKNKLIEIEPTIKEFFSHDEIELTKGLKEEIRKKMLYQEEKIRNMLEDVSVHEQLSTSVIKTLTETHDLLQLNKHIEKKPSKLYNVLKNQENNLDIDPNKDNNNPIILSLEIKKINEKIKNKLNGIMTRGIDMEDSKVKSQDFDIILSNISSYWKSNSVDITYDVIREGEANFEISVAAITSIIDNLISNSINHNKGKVVSIYIRLETSEKLLIKYSDTGSGLDLKYKNKEGKIFEMFETTSENGYGIGMWIIKSIVSRYNGETKIINEENKGFNIEILLRRYNGEY